MVTLTGSVTPDMNKAEEIAGEVARVRGVQEIRNEIVTLPPSFGDDRIRAELYNGSSTTSTSWTSRAPRSRRSVSSSTMARSRCTGPCRARSSSASSSRSPSSRAA